MTVTHDPPTEQALLGALLLNPSLIPQVADIITGDDLADPRHTTIYHTITTIAPLAPPGPIDPLILAQALATTGNLKGQLDATYLHTCLAACTNPQSATWYAHTIRHHATTRTLHQLAARLNQVADLDNPTQRHTQLTNLQHELATTINNTRGLNGRHTTLQPANLYRIKPVKWLWNTRIPIGEITLISGREGVGKSIFLAWLASAITNGNLPGIHHGTPRAILYAAAEDSWEYTIAPRMLAAGANLDLIYRIDMEEPDGTLTGINLPRDLHHLPDAINQIDAAALMLDPLLSVLNDTINVFKAPEVRAVLQPLRAAAEQTGIAIIGLAHYNKGRHTDSNSMIANSRAFVEVARAAIAIAVDPDADDYTCVLTQAKNNLGTLTLPSLNYTIDDTALETDEGIDAHVGRLRWTGESDTTADELLTGTAGQRPLTDTAQTILEWVITQSPPVTVQETAKHFQDTIKYETVKKTLARLTRSGHLLSPNRGLYQSPTKTSKTRRPGRNQPPKPGTPPIYPVPVPTVPNSLSLSINAGRERETGTEEEADKLSLGTTGANTENGQTAVGDSGDTRDRDTGDRARARARETHDQQPHQPTPEPPPDDDEPEPWWQR